MTGVAQGLPVAAVAVLLALLAAAESPPGAAPGVDVQGPPQPITGETFLRPNVRFGDGGVGYVHVTPRDMPWRVAIGRPKRPPKYGSSRQAREAAIEAMRMWEEAVAPAVPWFALEFVEEDPGAAVQVIWKRRIPASWAGFGGFRFSVEDGIYRVGGELEISTTPSPNAPTLTVEEVRLLVAHEFGHVLGLGHCLDCESAMNYSWHTRDRVLVTELDVRTFAALVAKPNGVAGD